MSDSSQPFNILTGNWKEVLKDYEEDIWHITNQMEESQVGSLGCQVFKQAKKDKRKNLEMTRLEAAQAKAEEEGLEKYVSEADDVAPITIMNLILS